VRSYHVCSYHVCLQAILALSPRKRVVETSLNNGALANGAIRCDSQRRTLDADLLSMTVLLPDAVLVYSAVKSSGSPGGEPRYGYLGERRSDPGGFVMRLGNFELVQDPRFMSTQLSIARSNKVTLNFMCCPLHRKSPVHDAEPQKAQPRVAVRTPSRCGPPQSSICCQDAPKI